MNSQISIHKKTGKKYTKWTLKLNRGLTIITHRHDNDQWWWRWWCNDKILGGLWNARMLELFTIKWNIMYIATKTWNISNGFTHIFRLFDFFLTPKAIWWIRHSGHFFRILRIIFSSNINAQQNKRMLIILKTELRKKFFFWEIFYEWNPLSKCTTFFFLLLFPDLILHEILAAWLRAYLFWNFHVRTLLFSSIFFLVCMCQFFPINDQNST